VNINTTWAEHHGTAAVEALIAQHPNGDANAIRAAANHWHATEDLAGFLIACDQSLAPPNQP
jgi:hypothetical protein